MPPSQNDTFLIWHIFYKQMKRIAKICICKKKKLNIKFESILENGSWKKVCVSKLKSFLIPNFNHFKFWKIENQQIGINSE